jgi:putative FmdB family regulatory protein
MEGINMTYDYVCTNCQFKDEMVVPHFEGSEILDCPKCKQHTFQRLCSPPTSYPKIAGGTPVTYGAKGRYNNLSASEHADLLCNNKNPY